ERAIEILPLPNGTPRVQVNRYQRIIGMGWAVVPFILRELERQPDHWFWALQSITGEAPAGEANTFQAAVEAWLRWGRDQGLLSIASQHKTSIDDEFDSVDVPGVV